MAQRTPEQEAGAEVENRIRKEALKPCEQYVRGLLTFHELMVRLMSIDDGKITEMVFAEWDDKFAFSEVEDLEAPTGFRPLN